VLRNRTSFTCALLVGCTRKQAASGTSRHTKSLLTGSGENVAARIQTRVSARVTPAFPPGLGEPSYHCLSRRGRRNCGSLGIMPVKSHKVTEAQREYTQNRLAFFIHRLPLLIRIRHS
jgi:hypothetical protein